MQPMKPLYKLRLDFSETNTRASKEREAIFLPDSEACETGKCAVVSPR